MTVNEAIEVLNGNIDDINRVVIARAVAIKALEKQIPKKLTPEPDDECQTCGRFVMGGKYCRECGQRIDWGE